MPAAFSRLSLTWYSMGIGALLSLRASLAEGETAQND
jgi:hypothetical protein